MLEDALTNFWPVLILNLPFVVIILIALNKRLFYPKPHVEEMEKTHARELKDRDENHARELAEKDKQITFINTLREQALADSKAKDEALKEQGESIRGLSEAITKFMDFNERLVDETLQEKGWDGNERRATAARRQ